MRSAAILIIGDEILSGEIADENGPFLLHALNEAGVSVRRVVTVPDQPEVIVAELRRLRALADAVILSGGVGPTHDDVTRCSVAEALGVELVVCPEAEERVRKFYPTAPLEAELAMARLPAGARLVNGQRTPTFGFFVAGIYALPGVPFLFRDIARGLPADFDATPLHRRSFTTSRREGEIAPSLAAIQARFPDVAIGSYPVRDGKSWHVRVVLRSADPARLEEVAAELDGVLS